jgi:predicted nucleic acid-binding protein
MIVVDASVMAKCYQPEPDSERAMNLIKSNQRLLAPALIRVEVSSAICKRVRSGEVKAGDAILRCEKWREHLKNNAVYLVENEDLLAEAEQLSVDLKHALQDCLYLALAQRERTILITADEPFVKKARPVYPEIELLSTYQGF